MGVLGRSWFLSQQLFSADGSGLGDSWGGVSSPKNRMRYPPVIPIKKVETMRNMAMTGPRNFSATIRESSPVCGVDVRKDVTALFRAPRERKEREVGTTEQEHKGKGMPSSDALTSGNRVPSPRCRMTTARGRNSFRMPATKKPSIRYGAMWTNMVIISDKRFIIRKGWERNALPASKKKTDPTDHGKNERRLSSFERVKTNRGPRTRNDYDQEVSWKNMN